MIPILIGFLIILCGAYCYSIYYDKLIDSYPIKYDIYDVAQYILLCAYKKQRTHKYVKVTNIVINCIMKILYIQYLDKNKVKLFNDFEWKAIEQNVGDGLDDKIWWIPKIWMYLEEEDNLRDIPSKELKDLKDIELKMKIYKLLEYDIQYLYLWAFYGIKP